MLCLYELFKLIQACCSRIFVLPKEVQRCAIAGVGRFLFSHSMTADGVGCICCIRTIEGQLATPICIRSPSRLIRSVKQPRPANAIESGKVEAMRPSGSARIASRTEALYFCGLSPIREHHLWDFIFCGQWEQGFSSNCINY